TGHRAVARLHRRPGHGERPAPGGTHLRAVHPAGNVPLRQILHRYAGELRVLLVRAVGDVEVVVPEHALRIAVARALVLPLVASLLQVVLVAEGVADVELLAVRAEQDGQRVAALRAGGVADQERGTVRQVPGALLGARVRHVRQLRGRPRLALVQADRAELVHRVPALVAEDHHRSAVRAGVPAGLQLSGHLPLEVGLVLEVALGPTGGPQRVVGVVRLDDETWLHVE